MIEVTKGAKMATGRTLASEWQQHQINAGVFIDVDTSTVHFTRTPTYITALHGFGAHWRITGGSSVYNVIPTGFRIYIRFVCGGPLTRTLAQGYGWHIQ